MKTLILMMGALALGAAGCGHMDLTPEGDPLRVLVGEVVLADSGALPEDAVVSVRIVDTSAIGQPPRVLGTQTLHGPFVAPVSFRIEYTAEDAVLRRGLNVEARVSVGGRIRYFNMNGHAVTLSNATDTHRIIVDASAQ